VRMKPFRHSHQRKKKRSQQRFRNSWREYGTAGGVKAVQSVLPCPALPSPRRVARRRERLCHQVLLLAPHADAGWSRQPQGVDIAVIDTGPRVPSARFHRHAACRTNTQREQEPRGAVLRICGENGTQLISQQRLLLMFVICCEESKQSSV
jgi:hypothetical protein